MNSIAFLCLILFAFFVYGLADSRKDGATKKGHRGKYVFQSTKGDSARDVYTDMITDLL